MRSYPVTGRPAISSSHPAVLKSPVARSSASAAGAPPSPVLPVPHPATVVALPMPELGGQGGQTDRQTDRQAGQVPDMRSASGTFHARTSHGEDGHLVLGFGVGFIRRPTNAPSPAATWLLTLPLPLLLRVASNPPAGPAKSRAGKAVLGRADLKILLPSDGVSISKQASVVWLMCCPALMVLGTRDWVGRYPISLLWSARPSSILTGRGPLEPPCRRSSVLGLTSSAALASPGRGISRFPPIPSPSPRPGLPGLPPRISLQIPIAALVDWLPPMAPATATLLLDLASWCWPCLSSVTSPVCARSEGQPPPHHTSRCPRPVLSCPVTVNPTWQRLACGLSMGSPPRTTSWRDPALLRRAT